MGILSEFFTHPVQEYLFTRYIFFVVVPTVYSFIQKIHFIYITPINKRPIAIIFRFKDAKYH